MWGIAMEYEHFGRDCKFQPNDRVVGITDAVMDGEPIGGRSGVILKTRKPLRHTTGNLYFVKFDYPLPYYNESLWWVDETKLQFEETITEEDEEIESSVDIDDFEKLIFS